MKNRFALETALILLCLAFLGIFAFLQLSTDTFGGRQPGAINSEADQGTQQLFNWLSQNGYDIQVAESDLTLGDASVLFIIAPTSRLNMLEVERLNQWVFSGGTLILVQEQNQAQWLLDKFDIRSRSLLLPQETASFNLPTLNWPLVGQPELNARAYYRVPCGEAAVHLGDCDRAHLAVFGWNAGQVVLLSSLYPLSNAGVQNPANAQLIQNLLNLVTSPGETIVVDESHHGNGFLNWWRSRIGLTLLATAVALIAYLVWQNQPFTTPAGHSSMVTEPEAMQSSSAFINHIADAQKLLDPERNVREHFWQQLKRKYSNRHGFDPRLPDEQFFDRLRQLEDEDTISQLIYIMTSMAKPQIVDIELMNWTAVTLDELSTGIGDQGSGIRRTMPTGLQSPIPDRSKGFT